MHRPWTKEELEVALNTSLPTEEISQKLNRSVQAIYRIRTKVKQGVIPADGSVPGGSDPCVVGSRKLLAKTCLGCGLLIDARFYHINRNTRGERGGNQSYHPYCSWCKSTREMKRRAEKQVAEEKDRAKKYDYLDYTLWPIPNNRQPWTDRDAEIASDRTLTVSEKAETLGRTYKSMSTFCSRNKFKSLHVLRLPERSKGQWQIQFPTPEEKSA